MRITNAIAKSDTKTAISLLYERVSELYFSHVFLIIYKHMVRAAILAEHKERKMLKNMVLLKCIMKMLYLSQNSL